MEDLAVVVEGTKKIVRENLKVSLSLSKDGLHKHIQHFLKIKPTDPLQSKIYQMLLANFIAAEKLSPGSGDMLLRLFIGQKIEDMPVRAMTKKQVLGELGFMSAKNLKIMEKVIDMSGTSTSVILKKIFESQHIR